MKTKSQSKPLTTFALCSFGALWLLPSSQVIAQDSFSSMGANTTGQPPVSQQQQPTGGMLSTPTQPSAPTTLNNNTTAKPLFEQPANGQYANVLKMETNDFGVAATSTLHTGPMHGPTPTSIPGAKLITTPELITLLQQNPGRVALFDVLGAAQGLPNAIPLVPASQSGDFNDTVQQQLKQYLQQLTQGNNTIPMVFYCQGVQCWMSYNAALRAANLGYTALWYRGGVEAWSMAGQQLQTMSR